MPDRLLLVSKAACLCLSLVVLLQLIGLGKSDGHLVSGSAPQSEPPKEGGTKEPEGSEAFLEAYALIATSGILGLASPAKGPPPPVLLGLMDSPEKKYAILKSGKSFLLAEGEEKNGVKLIRIGTNRVVVEYQGKETELSLFSGLGSQPLLTPEKEK